MISLRILVIVMIACAGCTPIAAPNQPNKQGPLPITSTGSADGSSPIEKKFAERSQHLKTLLSLIRERLELMPQVAQAKWNRKSPITDAKREATLLDDLEAKGVARGLRGDVVREFFRAQITAAKLIQKQHFADWAVSQQPPFTPPPDLERDIRPKIDKLNEQLLDALGQYLPERSNDGWKDELDRTAKTEFEKSPWSEEVVKTALGPLSIRSTTQQCLADSTLKRRLVGMTFQ